MTGALVVAGVDPERTALGAYLAAIWKVAVDLMASGIKVESLGEVYGRIFDKPDTADGLPDRETWGLLPEHVTGAHALLSGGPAATAEAE